MSQLEKLEQQVVSLPEDEYGEFRRWFLDRDWEKWDNEIEADWEAGKLDFLVEEAVEAKKRNRLRDL